LNNRSQQASGRCRGKSAPVRGRLAAVLLTLLTTFLILGWPCESRQADSRTGPQQSSQPPKEQLGQIDGRVLRADTEQPLSKAIVTLIPSSQPVQGISVRTDALGRFQFADVVPGTYRLRAQRNGFTTQAFGQRGAGPGVSVRVGAGQRLQNTDFRLDPAGVIAGTILDEDGDVVEGLLVHAIRMRFARGGRVETLILRTSRTDDAGDYRLPGLTAGYYLVQVGGRGDTVSINLQAPPVTYGAIYYPRATDRDDASKVKVTAGSVVRGIDVRVRSAPTYTISGVVVDSAPPSTSVRYSVGFAFSGGGTATAQAQRDGSFAFHGMGSGEYTLTASATDEGGVVRRGYSVVRVVDADVRLALEVGRTAEAGGQARMEDGKPYVFEGLRVEFSAENPEGVSAGSAVDEKGYFRIRSLPAGTYFVRSSGREEDIYLRDVRCAGESYSTKPIVLEPEGKVSDCEITFSRQVSTVRGQVKQNDKVADGMVVVLIPQEVDRRRVPRNNFLTQTDSDGQFQIKGVVPGDYFAFALPPMDDAAYFDLEFPERNREAATRVTTNPGEIHSLSLKVSAPR